MRVDVLNKANIPEDEHEYCYITENNIIFAPIFEDDILIKKGEDIYIEQLENKDKPRPLTEIEQLKINQASQFEMLLQMMQGGI